LFHNSLIPSYLVKLFTATLTEAEK